MAKAKAPSGLLPNGEPKALTKQKLCNVYSLVSALQHVVVDPFSPELINNTIFNSYLSYCKEYCITKSDVSGRCLALLKFNTMDEGDSALLALRDALSGQAHVSHPAVEADLSLSIMLQTYLDICYYMRKQISGVPAGPLAERGVLIEGLPQCDQSELVSEFEEALTVLDFTCDQTIGDAVVLELRSKEQVQAFVQARSGSLYKEKTITVTSLEGRLNVLNNNYNVFHKDAENGTSFLSDKDRLEKVREALALDDEKRELMNSEDLVGVQKYYCYKDINQKYSTLRRALITDARRRNENNKDMPEANMDMSEDQRRLLSGKGVLAKKVKKEIKFPEKRGPSPLQGGGNSKVGKFDNAAVPSIFDINPMAARGRAPQGVPPVANTYGMRYLGEKQDRETVASLSQEVARLTDGIKAMGKDPYIKVSEIRTKLGKHAERKGLLPKDDANPVMTALRNRIVELKFIKGDDLSLGNKATSQGPVISEKEVIQRLSDEIERLTRQVKATGRDPHVNVQQIRTQLGKHADRKGTICSSDEGPVISGLRTRIAELETMLGIHNEKPLLSVTGPITKEKQLIHELSNKVAHLTNQIKEKGLDPYVNIQEIRTQLGKHAERKGHIPQSNEGPIVSGLRTRIQELTAMLEMPCKNSPNTGSRNTEQQLIQELSSEVAHLTIQVKDRGIDPCVNIQQIRTQLGKHAERKGMSMQSNEGPVISGLRTRITELNAMLEMPTDSQAGSQASAELNRTQKGQFQVPSKIPGEIKTYTMDVYILEIHLEQQNTLWSRIDEIKSKFKADGFEQQEDLIESLTEEVKALTERARIIGKDIKVDIMKTVNRLGKHAPAPVPSSGNPVIDALKNRVRELRQLIDGPNAALPPAILNLQRKYNQSEPDFSEDAYDEEWEEEEMMAPPIMMGNGAGRLVMMRGRGALLGRGGPVMRGRGAMRAGMRGGMRGGMGALPLRGAMGPQRRAGRSGYPMPGQPKSLFESGDQPQKVRGPVGNGECYFWRTTGCNYGNMCKHRHVPSNKGIDKQSWHITKEED